MRLPFSKRTFILLAIAWTITLVIGLSLPRGAVPDLGGLFDFDKLIHAAIFACFAGLWLLGTRGPWWPRAGGVLLAAIVLAFGTEWLQGALRGGRTPDLYDAIADIIGASVVMIVHGFLWHLRQWKLKKQQA